MKRKTRPPEVTAHTRFGDIPRIPVERTLPDGRIWRGWEHDPDYRPPMPPGAVRGDVRKQSFCSMCHLPRYFFVDEEKRCVQCGDAFVFAAAEQKFWYETLKFHFDSTAIRCPACRRRTRTDKALREQLARVRAELRAAPDDPARLLELAEAIVTLHRRSGQGRLEDAISAARRARRRWPQAVESLYWEAAAQDAAGRAEKAAPLWAEFVGVAPARLRALREDARVRLG